MSVTGSPGTGTVTLNAALAGYLTFAQAGVTNGLTVTYEITEVGVGWEIGRGTYTSLGTTLSRDTVLINSAGNQTMINFSSAASVMITAAAEDLNVGEITTSPSADVDDYTGVSVAGSDVTLILTPSVSMNFNGVVPGVCRRLTIVNGTSGANARLVMLPHERSSTTADNRFAMPDRHARFLLPGESILFVRMGSRWVPTSTPVWMGNFTTFGDYLGTNTPWTAAAAGTGSGAAGQAASYLGTDTTQKPQGTARLDTGTTSSGTAVSGMFGGLHLNPAQGCAIGVARLAVMALSTSTDEFSVRFGFHDQSTGDTDVIDGVYWEYQRTASVNWSMVCAGASTRSKTASSVAVNTNYVWLTVFINADWTRADFFISQDGRVWTLAGSQSGANMPTSSETVAFSIALRKSAGTNSRTTEIDLLAYRYDALRGST